MDTGFGETAEIQVLRHGKEITRVMRPLRSTPQGPVVRYKRQLWPVCNNAINVSGKPFDEHDGFTEQDDENPAARKTIKPDTNTRQLIAVPEPLVRDASSIDQAQEAVLQAAPDQRLLVDAGPGTGKTHTACLKVATLIREHDIPPSRIWMISFTRAAVYEIRSRLNTLLGDHSEASGVRIATLDSLAWTIHSGFSNDAILAGSYDDNIDQTLAKVRTKSEIREELQKIRHLVVDEAQDIVGVRAEFVLSIMDTVSPDCGVTVFADQAQAIYGWTEDQKSNAIADGSSLLAELEDREFQSVSLTEVHRTDSPALLRIFRDVRRKVLDKGVSPLLRGPDVRGSIEGLADAKLGPAKNLQFSSLPANALVLLRQRSDVLITSSYNQGTPHRLRLSGLPVRMQPWPAYILWDYSDRRLRRDTFDRLWTERAAVRGDCPPIEVAWQLLFETAGLSSDLIDLHRLRVVLGRPNPPAAFASPDYGDDGPIIGTIHASKGREAEEVFLYLPPQPKRDEGETDFDEEIRVMFVGATRARRRLSIGSSSGKRLGNVGGRFWKKVRGNRIQVEIGRVNDICPEGLVGNAVFPTASDALASQTFLREHPIFEGSAAHAEPDLNWSFVVDTQEGKRICSLSTRVTADIKEIAKRCEVWPPPTFLPHIRSAGLRAIAIHPDDPTIELLHEPWRSSGFVLAPMLLGICIAKLKS